MAEDSEIPFGKKPRDWVIAWRIVVAVLAALGAVGGSILLFAGKSFVKDSVSQEIAGLSALPVQIKVLEDARTRESQRITNNTQAISMIQQDVAAIKAAGAEAQKNNDRNTERILNRLDQMALRR